MFSEAGGYQERGRAPHYRLAHKGGIEPKFERGGEGERGREKETFSRRVSRMLGVFSTPLPLLCAGTGKSNPEKGRKRKKRERRYPIIPDVTWGKKKVLEGRKGNSLRALLIDFCSRKGSEKNPISPPR